MKNNIVFKFIAIVLCAASLLGAVASIAGVFVLTEADLYNKTVPQVKEERIQQNALHYADSLAQMYASTELGGCSEQMAASVFDNGFWFRNSYPSYGYTIQDANGNVLSSYNESLKGTVQEFALPATGQYMHLVSVESESQIRAREAQEQMASAAATANAVSGQIPDNGILIDYVLIADTDGNIIYQATRTSEMTYERFTCTESGQGYSNSQDANYAGFLALNADGKLVYQSFLRDDSPISTAQIAEILFLNEAQSFEYRLHDPEGLGSIDTETGCLCFVSYWPVAASAETPAAMEITTPTEESVPMTTVSLEETIPATTEAIEASIPETSTTIATIDLGDAEDATQAAETVESVETTEAVTTETTVEESVPSSASAIPTTAPEETEPLLINGKTLDNYQVNTHRYYDTEAQEWMTASYVYLPMPELTVELYIDTDAMRDNTAYDLLELIRQVRSYLLPAIGICLLTFAIFAVYLCTAAGRKPKTDEVRAGGLNRLPLDLYLLGGGFLIACIAAISVEGTQILLRRDFYVGCGFAVAASFAACLIFVGFCFAFVAQIKTPGGFWWRNTLCGHCIRLCMNFAIWLETFLSTKGFPFLGKSIRTLWNLTVRFCKWLWQFTCKAAIWFYHSFETSLRWVGAKTGKAFRWIGHKLHRWLSLMPVTWQWTVTGLFLFCMTLIAGTTYNDALTMLCLVGSIALVLYGAHCFGVLLDSTRKMGKGDLDTKVDDKLMIGCFKEFAEDLNDLADVAVVAAQKQLKSERMKTELITNVSHDIKTPLTSIINYVDLLQKPHSDAEEAQYLEVLDRQSQRLKKLIDDLMEMSKANTGNMQVDITRVDAVESVNQALGEFADKLTRAQLIPVFRHDDPSVPMMADGRLVWRVMSNLLSNAVKYAMPGTRLYIDLMALEGRVVISLKNISREELNIDADELMERFVRGDDSRNTEGSGLGLNIAKSLMELQKGQLQLLVDGDLFKVTLIFPGI